jgi:hypothetical protein
MRVKTAPDSRPVYPVRTMPRLVFKKYTMYSAIFSLSFRIPCSGIRDQANFLGGPATFKHLIQTSFIILSSRFVPVGLTIYLKLLPTSCSTPQRTQYAVLPRQTNQSRDHHVEGYVGFKLPPSTAFRSLLMSDASQRRTHQGTRFD